MVLAYGDGFVRFVQAAELATYEVDLLHEAWFPDGYRYRIHGADLINHNREKTTLTFTGVRRQYEQFNNSRNLRSIRAQMTVSLDTMIPILEPWDKEET